MSFFLLPVTIIETVTTSRLKVLKEIFTILEDDFECVGAVEVAIEADTLNSLTVNVGILTKGLENEQWKGGGGGI